MDSRDRFDKFTERARKVLDLAQVEAQRRGHSHIGTEHLLLGLVSEGEGVAAKVLSNLGIELFRVRAAVEALIGQAAEARPGEIGLTTRAKKVIELAVDESRRMNHHYIGTEHLLLGLVREREGIAAGVLESLGIDLEKVRTQTIQVLSLGETARRRQDAAARQAETARQTAHDMAQIAQAEMRKRRLAVGPSHYNPYHITSEAPDKTPIGKLALSQEDTSTFTLLGWVTVNTGGTFTLTLYHSMAADAPKIAVISNPATGTYFPFYCPLEQGLAYIFTGTPGSVTIMYADRPAQ